MLLTWVIFWGIAGVILGRCIFSVKKAWHERQYIKAVFLVLLTFIIFVVIGIVHRELKK